MTGRRISGAEKALFGIVLLGAALRLRQYLANQSLWMDEAMIGLNILGRSFGGLLAPLDMNQAAPPGFLFAEKTFTLLFGTSEFALRAYPLLCSITSLVVAAWVGLRTTTPIGACVAVAVLATCGALIGHSSEAKQYSSDAAVSLALLALALRTRSRRLDASALLVLGGACAVLVWFSHPAAFVVAGICLYLVAVQFREGPTAPSRLFLVFVPVAVSFATLYIVVLSRTAGNEYLRHYWREYFAPFPPRSLAELRWYLVYPLRTFDDPLSLPLPEFGAFLFLAGCIAYAIREGTGTLILLLAPIACALLASTLGLYPFGGRLLVFLIPMLALIMAHGVSALWAMDQRKRIAAAAIGLLLVPPATESVYRLARPRMSQDLKPALREMRQSFHQGDRVYVYHRAAPSFRFYATRFGFDESAATLEPLDTENSDYFQEWSRGLSSGDRCWLVFAYFERDLHERVIANYRRILEARQGRELSTSTASGVSIFLYAID
jgi:4-amino-4-deoxy-L-arabinose transferase-like glycosyltransferase